MKMVRYAKTGSIISGAAFMICGLLIALFPSFSILAVNNIIGAVLIVSGIVRIIGYFSYDLYSLAFQFDLALGIFSIISGIIFLLHPKWLASVFPIVIGIGILICSLFMFQTAVDSKKFGLKYWWVILILSIISSVLVLLVIFNPFTSAKILMTFVGISIIIAGAEKIFLSIYTIVVAKKDKEKEKYIDVTDYTYKDKEDQN